MFTLIRCTLFCLYLMEKVKVLSPGWRPSFKSKVLQIRDTWLKIGNRHTARKSDFSHLGLEGNVGIEKQLEDKKI